MPTRQLNALPALFALLFSIGLAMPAQAHLIIGQVVDAQGVGVPGVDIDVENLRGGGDPTIFNDGTDASGFFSTTVVEPGVFSISFRAPSPPVTTLLTSVVPNTVVVGTVDLGVITLSEGVGFKGRLLGPTGIPAGNVNMDIRDESGVTLSIPGDFTDLFGQFHVALPAQPLEIRMNTLGVLTETLAPQVLELDFTDGAAVDLGDYILPRGYHVTATILHPATNLPVPGVDSDTYDSATGEQLYTPGDNTSSTGVLDLVLPQGTFDIVVCPAVSTGLAAAGISPLPVNGDTPLGPFIAMQGVPLQGTVVDALGQPVSGVDLDVNNVFGNELWLCGDSTNVAGQYAIVVPPGTWQVEFTPSYSKPFGSRVQNNVVVQTSTLLNVALPDCPTHVDYGSGFAGTGGVVPTLSASGGSARLGNPNYTLEISGGRGAARAVVVSGFEAATTPFKGGVLLVGGPVPPQRGVGAVANGMAGKSGPGGPQALPVLGMFSVALDGPKGAPGAGSASHSEPIPNDPALAGFSRYMQVLVKDPAAAGGWAFSQGIRVDYCP